MTQNTSNNRFIGTKEVLNIPMTRGEYNKYRGWVIPEDENPNDEGYLVEHLDDGKPNHPDHTGYISWSPKKQCDNTYRENGKFNYGDAIYYLKQYKLLQRAGWNGKNMYIFLYDSIVDFKPFVTLMLCNAKGEHVQWAPSLEDQLANDWSVISF